MPKPIIKLKRAYESATSADGFRILVDRLWPRGVRKENAKIDDWAKEIAPTTELRKWYDHDPAKWIDFQKKYISELKTNEALSVFIESIEDKKRITLIYGTKDQEHTHALVLQKYLVEHFQIRS